MPFYLEEKDMVPELVGFKSILIIPCRFCPAASAAVRDNKPYFEFFRRRLKTEAFEQQIRTLQTRLRDRGIKANVFKSHLLHQFILCMWTERRRRKLKKVASKFEAAIVVGCEAGVQTVIEAIKSTSCRVLHGTKTEGIMNVVPNLRLPGNLWIKCEGINRVLH